MREMPGGNTKLSFVKFSFSIVTEYSSVICIALNFRGFDIEHETSQHRQVLRFIHKVVILKINLVTVDACLLFVAGGGYGRVVLRWRYVNVTQYTRIYTFLLDRS